jgi:hypothetical protein
VPLYESSVGSGGQGVTSTQKFPSLKANTPMSLTLPTASPVCAVEHLTGPYSSTVRREYKRITKLYNTVPHITARTT